ncbi:hypothetical protein J2125_000201 [Erwinia toletana]|uniref:DUF4917 domain-containing protein n=1 Tax=Winslowiella toletana TaxID=92490 RepID=A0ABS4P2X7_9GAMM|nr:DUF4917 family protein [Winslowiella toletana]MBP2167009.1 hypothetical protein [Winslowiella toletana]
MDMLTFKQALEKSSGHARRALLGNGFSIACRPQIFLYGKLFEQADFSKLSPSAKKVFENLKTEDFEKVISTLQDSCLALTAYTGDNDELIRSMDSDALALRELLVQTLALSHPAHPGELDESEYQHCKSFLENFDRIYTLNYDLLLYWVCMHCAEGEEPSCDDGFRKAYQNYDAPYVTWEPTNAHKQSMFFLHGALHLFDAGYELRKYTWVNTNVKLIDQIRTAISNNLFPVFVSEGKSKEKIERIRHNDYLAKAYRSFVEIGGALFIYGHSLAENDEHFLKKIEQGKIRQLYVGIYGDADSELNAKIITRANLMAINRKKGTLEVFFYDAKSANVWSS